MSRIWPHLLGYILIPIFIGITSGQSADQSEPTLVPGNELVSNILPRDFGDSRLTEHFFKLRVQQGDLFVNLTHRNLIGDVDIFSIDGRRPMAKLTVVESVDDREIGRVVFIRNSGQILIRVLGRTPNDDPATYRIKFGGSAVTNPLLTQVLDLRKPVGVPDLSAPELAPASPGRPQATPEGAEVAIVPKVSLNEGTSVIVEKPLQESPVEPIIESKEEVNEKETIPAPEAVPSPKVSENTSKPPASSVVERRLFLRIEFDDGGKLERPMSSVQSVGIDKNELVIKLVTGNETRYPISSVVRFTVD
jgi:hypothetical protein